MQYSNTIYTNKQRHVQYTSQQAKQSWAALWTSQKQLPILNPLNNGLDHALTLKQRSQKAGDIGLGSLYPRTRKKRDISETH